MATATISNTPGTVTTGSEFTFDGSSSVGDSFSWTLTSKPVGSTVGTPVPFPDSGATTPIDMTANEGLYHLDGNADDSSGNSRNGTVTGATAATGLFDQGYQFGVSDYIDLGTASTFLSASDDFSVSLWLKGDAGWAPIQYDAIFGFSNGFVWSEGVGLHFQGPTGGIRAFVGAYNTHVVDTGPLSSINIEDWNHLAVTYTAGTLKIFLNGELKATNAGGSTLTGLAQQMQLGRLGTHGNLEATLDEFALWSRGLSDAEVEEVYGLQSVGFVSTQNTLSITPDIDGTYDVQLEATDGGGTDTTTGTLTASAAAPGGGGGGSDCGPPSTQVIPLRALASSQAYPSVTAALVIPVVARAGTQYIPDVERDSTQVIPHIYCNGLVADTLTVASAGTGQVLQDQYGTLPTDDNDVYLDPYTGEYLVIDSGYGEGDDLGELAVYGMPAATVAGVPATHRRRGFNTLANTTSTTQGHVVWNMADTQHTYFSRNSHRANPASEVVAIGLESAERWGLQTINTSRMDAKVWGAGGALVRTVSLSSTNAFQAGETYSVAVGADSAGALRLDVWNGAGTSLGSLSGGFAALTTLGNKDYAIGRGISGGDWTIGTIHEFLVFDGAVEDNATTSNIEADVRAGVDLDVVKATYGATYATDGLITGVHSREAVEQLITLSGTGALPTASTQTAIGTYTQASDVNNLIGDWDAYREALYNGSSKLEGIQDFSGLDRHMTVRETVAPEHVASTCTMLGRSVTLPGRGTTTVANYAEYALTGTLNDFTLGFIIPTYQAGTAGNNQTLFSIEHTTGAENLILRTDPVNDNQLDVIDHTGAVVASVDIGYAAGNGSAANAIVFLRRTGGQMTLNSWHFEDAGGSTVEETPVVFSDSTFRASFDMNGIAFGGLINGASTHWAGLLHRCVMYDRALTTVEVEAVAASFAGRLGLEGVGPPLSPPAVGDTVVTTGGDSVTTDSGDPVVTTA